MYAEGKKCAMLRSFRLVPGLNPDDTKLLQPPFTQQHNLPILQGRSGTLISSSSSSKLAFGSAKADQNPYVLCTPGILEMCLNAALNQISFLNL